MLQISCNNIFILLTILHVHDRLRIKGPPSCHYCQISRCLNYMSSNNPSIPLSIVKPLKVKGIIYGSFTIVIDI